MKTPTGYRIVIDHPVYNEDTMVWLGSFRQDTLLLTVLKCKIDMALQFNLGVAAAYSINNLGTGLIEKQFGKANQFVITPFYD